MTEDPISITELQNYCQELPPEQTQDILDVILFFIIFSFYELILFVTLIYLNIYIY